MLWNHGDKQDWLIESSNQTYNKKKQLLEEYDICVWRFHDYIHSGVKLDNEYKDGIFYGLAKALELKDFKLEESLDSAVYASIKQTTAREFGEMMKRNLHLNSIKCIGNLDAKVTKVLVCGHINEGMNTNELIKRIDKEDINLLLPLELIDFTLSEYIKDSGQLGLNRCILAPGHFNIEEPGMKYMENWLPQLLDNQIKVTFIQAGDMYSFI